MLLDTCFSTIPFAHRALHDVTDCRPENSPAAIRAAIAAGYGIEIDIQMSSDGVAMVFHDYALERLTGERGAIRQRSSTELSKVILLGGTEGIPTLGEVLELVAGAIPVLIEIKDQDGALGPNVGVLEEAVAKDLQGYVGPVAVMSFNPHSVAAMAIAAPDVPRGLTTSAYDPDDWGPVPRATCDRLRDIPDYDATGSCFISHEAQDLGRPRVAELKAQGANVSCWTIRSLKAEAEARKIADNVTFEGYLP